ncbi:MAG: FtsX-like permease family protein [Chloroflexota bacterium]
MARTQPIVSTVTMLVVAAVCAVILATVGQSAAAEARILATIDDAGTRTIIVSDPTGRAVLHPDSVEAVRSLASVEWALGLGPVTDVRNAALGSAGRAVPARRVYGSLPDPVRLAGGRAPVSGEAIATKLGLVLLGSQSPAGGIQGEGFDASLVGTFTVTDPLTFLDGSLLMLAAVAEPGEMQALRQLVVVASSVDSVGSLLDAIPSVLHAHDRTQVRVATPTSLVELRSLVEAELATNSRQQLLVVLGVGLVVISVTLSGAVAQRRRDFGRRRALGATRSALVLLVIVQTAVAAVIGTVFGTAVGLVAVGQLAGALPPLDFLVGVAVLALLAALFAAIPPGVAAAFRDPVRILRVP